MIGSETLLEVRESLSNELVLRAARGGMTELEVVDISENEHLKVSLKGWFSPAAAVVVFFAGLARR